MKKFLFFFFLLPVFVGAQNANIKRTWHWYFGHGAGLDFTNGNPDAVTNGALYTNEGCASISDTSGNLLFYSDGVTVWNRNHQTMTNGTGLLGSQSTTQAALIIPMPDSDSLFYLFTNDCVENNLANGCRFNIVDMSLDGGLGAVTLKNELLFDTVTEKLTGIQGIDNDYWILIHEIGNNIFHSYHLTSTGLDTIPILSTTGPLEDNGANTPVGYLKSSPDGNKIALATDFSIELYNFNKSNGQLSLDTAWVIDSAYSCIYGLSFSSDNSKLYVSNGCSPGAYLFQFNLLSVNIPSSKVIIYHDYSYSVLGGMQLAPNGKIYLARRFPASFGTYLCAINHPNYNGVSCDFDSISIYLQGKYCAQSSCNFVQTYFNGVIENNIDEVDEKKITIYPNPSNDKITIHSDGYFVCIFISVLGKEIFRQSSFQDKEINVSDLPSGIYFLKIITQGKIIIQKQLIIHF